MARTTGDDPSEHSVDELAHMLLDAAQADPLLRSRSQAEGGTPLGAHPAGMPAERPDRRPQMRSASGPLQLRSEYLPSESGADSHIEQLVAIAIASAQQAEDASRLAARNGRVARRTIAAAVMISTLGVVVGVAGIVDRLRSDGADARWTRLAGEMHALADRQQQTTLQVTRLVARAALPAGVVASADRDAASGTAGGATVPAGGHLAAPEDQTSATPVSDIKTTSGTVATMTADAPTAVKPTSAADVSPQPDAAAPLAAIPTQPYGVHPVARDLPPYAAPAVPLLPEVSAHVERVSAPVRRTAPSWRRASSGNPVQDFGNLVVAIRDRVSSIFRP